MPIRVLFNGFELPGCFDGIVRAILNAVTGTAVSQKANHLPSNFLSGERAFFLNQIANGVLQFILADIFRIPLLPESEICIARRVDSLMLPP